MRESIRMKTKDYKFKFRVAGIIIHDNKLLTVNTKGDENVYLPGGYVELSETTEEAVLRELKEELLLDFEIKQYLGVLENFFDIENGKVHEISFYYLMNTPDKLNKEDFSLTENDKGFIVNHDFKWVDLNDLKNYDFRPKILIDILQSDNKVFNHLVFNNLK